MKKTLAFMLAFVLAMFPLATSISATSYTQIVAQPVGTLTTSAPIVVDGTILEISRSEDTIQGYILCNNEKLEFDCSIAWYELSSSDLLDGTLVADILSDSSKYPVLNVSIGKDREAALRNVRSYNPDAMMFKIAMYDESTNTYYSATMPIDNSKISTIASSFSTITNESNSELYDELVMQEKWYNVVFREQQVRTNRMTVVDDTDVASNISLDELQSLTNDEVQSLANDIDGISLTKLFADVGETKFQMPNRIFSPGITTNGSSYFGYYMETYEDDGGVIVSYIIYYTLTLNATRNGSSTPNDGYASIQLNVAANHEIWYYPSSDEYVDWGDSQLRMRNVGVGISLTGSNPDFIWSMYEEAHTSSGVTQIPTFGVEFIPTYGQYISAAINLFNTITGSINSNGSSGSDGRSCELPMDPDEHFDQCEGYLRQVTSKVEQGFNNKWFSNVGDKIILRTDLYSESSSTTKTVTYNVTYEVCFPNAILWYETVETVNDQCSKTY